MNPAKLMVDNRSPNKISILLKKFSSFNLERFERNDEPIDLLINATSAALSGPFDWDIQNQLNKETIFYDLSYGKASKKFFSWSSQFSKIDLMEQACFIAQAAFSFQLWFDTFPDISNINLSNVND